MARFSSSDLIHIYITNLDFNTYDLSKRLQIRDELLLLFSLQMRARRKKTTLLLVMYNEVFILLLMGGTGTEQKNEYMYINRLYCDWICPQIVTIFYPYEVMRLVSKHDNPNILQQ